MRKIIKDDMVAVLVSPGYGAGWSTWIDSAHPEAAVFCPEIITAILAGATGYELEPLAKHLFGNVYCGGLKNLEVRWVPVGKQFRIHEYDGSESIEFAGECEWLTA